MTARPLFFIDDLDNYGHEPGMKLRHNRFRRQFGECFGPGDEASLIYLVAAGAVPGLTSSAVWRLRELGADAEKDDGGFQQIVD